MTPDMIGAIKGQFGLLEWSQSGAPKEATCCLMAVDHCTGN